MLARAPGIPLVGGLIGMAWLALLVWGQSPYARFLNHKNLDIVRVDGGPVLLELLRDPSWGEGVRWTAAICLGSLESAGAPAVPDLIKTLKIGSLRAKRHAAFALGAIGPEARAAIPDLRVFLLAKENDAPDWPAEALGNMGKDAVPALTDGVKEERSTVHHASLVGLSLAGPSAASALVDAIDRQEVCD